MSSKSPNLLVAQDVAKERISARILIGEDLLEEVTRAAVQSMSDLEALRAKYTAWNHYNAELLRRQLFDGSQYADDYLYVGVTGVRWGERTLENRKNELQREIKRQNDRLRDLHGRIELIPVVWSEPLVPDQWASQPFPVIVHAASNSTGGR
jgi:hypothetical protein